MTPKVCLLLPGGHDLWRLDNLRRAFEAVARQFEGSGWEATIAAPASSLAVLAARGHAPRTRQLIAAPRSPIPLLTGLGREASSAPLRESYEVAQALWNNSFDRIVAPLGGGVAHGVLMARATDAAFRDCAVSIWWDDSSARRLLGEAERAEDFDPLVADAMERITLRLADVVMGAPDLRPIPGGPGPGPAARRLSVPALDGAPPRADAPRPAALGEIVFVGPGGRRTGLPDFLDAVEALRAKGALGDRRITFLGPMRQFAEGWSKEVLGVRAQAWDFRFSVEDVETPSAAMAYLREPGRLAVLPSGASDLDAVAAELISTGRPIVIGRDHPDAEAAPSGAVGAAGPAALEQALERALAGEIAWAARHREVDWVAASAPSHPSSLVRALRGMRQALSFESPAARVGPGSESPRLTVCITHRDRPRTLREAVASIEPNPLVRVTVVDNQSVSEEADAMLREISQRPDLTVVRLAATVQQAAACNIAAASADTDYVAFLDDDNAFAPGGVEALLAAMEAGRFDIVVSNLDVYDDRLDGEPAGRTIFLGDAGTAGLFFNGFGDTSMAVRRAAFLEIGGFDADRASGPALDWVFLAKARAQGLGIGALQTPAVKYRRDLLDAERKWRKRDKEGALKAVLDAYGGAYDPQLLARYAQGLAMGLV